MLSFEQVESNYGKKEHCEEGCSWIIKFFHRLDFGHHKFGIVRKKKMHEVNKF